MWIRVGYPSYARARAYGRGASGLPSRPLFTFTAGRTFLPPPLRLPFRRHAYFTPVGECRYQAKIRRYFPDTSKNIGDFSRYQQKLGDIFPIPAKTRRKNLFRPRFLVKSEWRWRASGLSKHNAYSIPISTQLTQGLRPPNLADL